MSGTVRAAVRFEGVGKRFPDGTRGLHGVSIDVPKGQFCVLLGRSGAGKSTLLRMVNGLVDPTSGSVWVDGVRMEPKTRRGIRQRVAMIHQHFNLAPRATVLQNILNGALREISTPAALIGLFPRPLRRKACRLLAEVGLGEDHLYRRASSLSGGQQQRVGIARAFILDPAVVLADEPVASLDPSISRDILSLLRREARETGSTVLCSLHQVDLAKEFGDRVVGLRHGEIVYDGPPGDLDPTKLKGLYEMDHGPSDTGRDAPRGNPLPLA